MKMLKICKATSVIKDKSPKEIEQLAKAFDLSKKPTKAIVDLLEHMIMSKDRDLENIEYIYREVNKPDLFIASVLSQRAVLLKLHDYLTTYVDEESYVEDKNS